MTPVIALVGRPNVGKSTLFNVLTRSRDALVVDLPGVTRDRQYGHAEFKNQPLIIVDTGGLSGDASGIDGPMSLQVKQAIDEAHMVLFLVDGRQGICPGDEVIAKQLRCLKKPVILVVNKTDGIDPNIARGDFFQLGLGKPQAIAASHRRGVSPLIHDIFEQMPDLAGEEVTSFESKGVKIALIGRPNVGKSTLTNRLIGEDRVVVFDRPGTTRDSIYASMNRHGKDYTIIDTAGVRRKGKVKETLEKFSVVKTLSAIDDANIVIALFDAQEGLVDQDLHVLQYALEAGRGLVIAFNKWDGLDQDHKQHIKDNLQRQLGFVLDYVDVHYISALHGTGVGHLFDSVDQAYASATKKMATHELTQVLEQAMIEHQPPLVRGRRIKLRYAHMGGHNPPLIVLHGNQTTHLPEPYQRYLINCFRQAFKLVGTPIQLALRTSDNPYAGRRNKLTPRQQQKRQRMMRHVKK